MKTKYDSPIQRDRLIYYAIAFLTIIAGTAWWAWIHPATNPNNQQPISSQVQNPQTTANQNTSTPANPGKLNNTPLPTLQNSGNPQLAEKLKNPVQGKV
jgi:hypothetical protein